ncbi:hypothetical protein ONZ45_g15544 [Pleurotus djamor]|nr:hypothetical protein ONZ45_g15544 [Pleurotus djamor]
MTFADLPPELTAKIGQYLPRCDLLEFSLACRGARNAIKHLLFYQISVRSEDLSFDSDLANALINDQVICKAARDLKIVHIEGKATEILYYCMLRLRELESLSIEIHDRDRPPKVDDKVAITDSEEYHGIKDVQHFTAVCTRMKTLRHIRLEMCENEGSHNDTAGYIHLIHPLPPVEKLHIVWNLRIKSESAWIQFAQRLLARAADTLTHFTWDVRSAWLSDMMLLQPVLKLIPNIQHLDISGSSTQLRSISEVNVRSAARDLLSAQHSLGMPPSPSPSLLLPLDLWTVLVEWLPISDLRNFSLVCKLFHDIAWSPLFRRLRVNPVDIIDIPKKINKLVRHISIVGIDTGRDTFNDGAYRTLSSFRHITSLSYQGVYNYFHPLRDLVVLCATIHQLPIDTIDLEFYHDRLVKINPHQFLPFPALKTLHVSWEMNTRDLATAYIERFLARSMTTLTDFKLEVTMDYDEEDRRVLDLALRLVVQIPQLEHLTLIGLNMAISLDKLPSVCSRLHHLKHLRTVCLLLETNEDVGAWDGAMISAAYEQTLEFGTVFNQLGTVAWYDTDRHRLEFHVHEGLELKGNHIIHATYADWMEDDHLSALGACIVDRSSAGDCVPNAT